MTSGKAVQLKKVADAVACAKCQTNPRFGSLQRCKQCLRADAEAERIARERLPPPQSATMSNRQQAGTARAAGRKPRATLSASKALTVVRPDPRAVVPSIVAEPVRELGRPYSITEWQARITQALKWFRVAKAEVQSRMVEESQAAKMIAANTQHARITYGSSPLVTLQPRSNVGLSFVHWALERAGVRIDLVDQYGDITDIRTVCPYCDAKVKRPCNESRSRNCANRSRGNR